MGWMAWDLMRGVDLLLARPGIDKEKIILLGVGGRRRRPGGRDGGARRAHHGASCRSTSAARSRRRATRCRRTRRRRFNYAGGGSWESTRNLRRSARDGFLPWVIVGASRRGG